MQNNFFADFAAANHDQNVFTLQLSNKNLNSKSLKV